MYSLKSQIYLDKITKCYKKIITINKDPCDERLNPIIKKLQNVRLSIFNEDSCNCSNRSNCIIALTNPTNTHQLLEINDIPDLFTFLAENGYVIDETTTKIMLKTSEKIKNLICFIKRIN